MMNCWLFHSWHATSQASHLEASHPARNHGAAFDRAARRPDAHHVAVPDTLLARECLGDLDEEIRLKLAVGSDVLGPVVKMFGEAIGRADVRELLRRAER